ncbi:hypothetical protein [uncultured Subdoligranulum sp.]|uniref:hypothetical protein n=1 Tax=uncultured Subdoligranulum sp. TaxID=512298 RepID=UPI0025CE6F65|nr:hypothetical protein [uncultured Subdoligranulum sp.]
MVLVTGLPYGCVLWRAVVANGITPLMLAVAAVFLAVPLAALIALGYFLGVKLAYIQMLSTLGRGGVQQLVGKPCTLRLQDGILYDEGPAVGPLAAKVTRPAASLRTVRTGTFGLVLVFRDGTSLGVPLSAFNREQPLPRWKQALEQAMAAPVPDGGAAAAEADAPVGFSCKEGGDPVLVQQCDPARADAICRESLRAVRRVWAFWRRNWVSGLVLLLSAVYMVWAVVQDPSNVLFLAFTLGAVYLFWRYSVRKMSQSLVGKNVTVFAPGAMVCTNLASGVQGRLPYTEELWLMVTSRAISLYQPRYNALWNFDRQAFATPQEEAEFLELLKQRFTAIHSCE